jgi:hypothetical protein
LKWHGFLCPIDADCGNGMREGKPAASFRPGRPQGVTAALCQRAPGISHLARVAGSPPGRACPVPSEGPAQPAKP